MQTKWNSPSTLPNEGRVVIAYLELVGSKFPLAMTVTLGVTRWPPATSTILGWMPMPYEKQQPEKELNMEAKWYGKDVKPEIGQKVIVYFKNDSDGAASSCLKEYKYFSNKLNLTFLDNPNFIAWTPLPKSKEEMEKEQLKQEIKSAKTRLENFLNLEHASIWDLSRSFLNEVVDLLKRLS